jgi:hypothetical protein
MLRETKREHDALAKGWCRARRRRYTAIVALLHIRPISVSGYLVGRGLVQH